MRKKLFEWFKGTFGKRKHIANWLSNMSVGTFIVGAFQQVDQFQFLGENTQPAIIGMAIIEFVASILFAKQED